MRVYAGRCFPWICLKPATVERDGKWYCKIHDPEYSRQKAANQQKQWDKEHIENLKRWELENARTTAIIGLTLEELKRVTPDLIRKALEGKNAEDI